MAIQSLGSVIVQHFNMFPKAPPRPWIVLLAYLHRNFKLDQNDYLE